VIELIEQGPEALPQAKAFNREQALQALQRRDVRLRTHTQVRSVGSDHLLLRALQAPGSQEERLPVSAVVWTAGLRFPLPQISPAPALGARGRLRCHHDLRLLDQERVFVAGDLADTGEGLPSTAQVAFQQASCLATNLRRSLAQVPLEPFQWQDLGEMLSLGVGEACLTAGGLTLAGRAADAIRRLAYLTRLPGRPHQVRVAAGWLADWLH